MGSNDAICDITAVTDKYSRPIIVQLTESDNT